MDSYQAFECNILIKSVQKVSSFIKWKNKIIISQNNGNLLIYDFKGKNGLMNKITNQQTITRFTKKGITQMSIVKPKFVLVALFDQKVQLINLLTWEKISLLCQNKALIFSYNGKKSLCVGCKDQLIIFKWENETFQQKKNIPLQETPITLEWIETKTICIGFKKDYKLINIRDETLKVLFTTGKNGIPLSTLINNSEILLQRDKISLFKDSTGDTPRSYGIAWSEIPEKIIYFEPYIIGVFQHDLRIKTLSTQKMVQKINLEGVKQLYIEDNISPSLNSNKGGKENNNDKEIKNEKEKKNDKTNLINKKNKTVGYFLNKKGIWRLNPIPLLVQVDMLCYEKHYEEALQLCQLIDTLKEQKKQQKIRFIKLEFAFYLFDQRKFERSMMFFNEIHCDPRIVLSLYDFLVPKEFYEGIPIPVYQTKTLDNNEQNESIFALIEYLTQQRNSVELEQFKEFHKIRKILDTILLKAYIQTEILLVSHFLRLPNYCDFNESEVLLKEKGLENELITLYKSKGKHKLALELIEKQISENKNIGKILQYLKFLDKNDLDLIFHYSKKLYQIAPNECLQVFIYEHPMESNEPKRNLPKLKIKKFLQENIPKLVIPYLEYQIYELKTTNSEFHNDLLLYYYEEYQLYQNKFKTEMNSNDFKQVANFLKNTREKITRFVNESKYYTPEKMLTRFPEDELNEERAIFLSRVGQHEQALDIYVHKLKKYKKAEEYCVNCYQKDGKTKDIFIVLLEQFLNPQVSEKKLIEPALNILTKHFEKIDPFKVFSLLPQSELISEFIEYLTLVIINITKRKRKLLVIKNLEKTANLNLNMKALQYKSDSKLIDKNTLCQYCGKRIGDSIIGRYPNGIIVHLSCIKNKHICPKTKTNFSESLGGFY
ncbi:cnh domain containing [Anaeramoeba flamelloides]|uniref:Cnh domain containing n=1 Tax=Anaeramoeba flamelloides TaxID=1746091 RepID=A0ABQ8XX53_9EUKA|nr:cnh domain containing [Anaeramoeba flamelloides]